MAILRTCDRCGRPILSGVTDEDAERGFVELGVSSSDIDGQASTVYTIKDESKEYTIHVYSASDFCVGCVHDIINKLPFQGYRREIRVIIPDGVNHASS